MSRMLLRAIGLIAIALVLVLPASATAGTEASNASGRVTTLAPGADPPIPIDAPGWTTFAWGVERREP